MPVRPCVPFPSQKLLPVVVAPKTNFRFLKTWVCSTSCYMYLPILPNNKADNANPKSSRPPSTRQMSPADLSYSSSNAFVPVSCPTDIRLGGTLSLYTSSSPSEAHVESQLMWSHDIGSRMQSPAANSLMSDDRL